MLELFFLKHTQWVQFNVFEIMLMFDLYSYSCYNYVLLFKYLGLKFERKLANTTDLNYWKKQAGKTGSFRNLFQTFVSATLPDKQCELSKKKSLTFKIIFGSHLQKELF